MSLLVWLHTWCYPHAYAYIPANDSYCFAAASAAFLASPSNTRRRTTRFLRPSTSVDNLHGMWLFENGANCVSIRM
jgi:hypothetical protein